MNVCSISDCDNKVFGHGWCSKHYKRWYRHGNTSTVLPSGNDGPGRERKTTKKATVKPTTKDLYWAAGFLEGDGNFTGGGSNSNAVSAAQVNREPLDRLLTLFGGNMGYEKRDKPRNSVHKWWVCGARARGVMMTLYPLLSARRQEQIRAKLA